MLANLRSQELLAFRGPVLLDPLGIPRYWATAWLSFLPSDLASATVSKKLTGIDALYRYCEECHGLGFLDDALARFDEEALCDALEGYFLAIRNRPPITPASEERWQAALQFVLDILARLGRSSESLQVVSSRFAHFELLQSHLHVGRRRRPERVRSLPVEALKALYDMLDPDSSRNPFRPGRTRWLVYATFILLLHQGLRRGELLSCPVNVIKSGQDPESGHMTRWMGALQRIRRRR